MIRAVIIFILFFLPFFSYAQTAKIVDTNKDFLARSGEVVNLDIVQDNTTLTLIKSSKRVCRFLFFSCTGGVADIILNENQKIQRLDVVKNQKIPLNNGSVVIKEVNNNQIKAVFNKPNIKSVSREVGNVGDNIILKVDGLTDKNIVIDFAPENNFLYSRSIKPRIESKDTLSFSIPDGIDPLCKEERCPNKPLAVNKGNFLISVRTLQGQSQVVPFFVLNSPQKLSINNNSQLPKAVVGRDYNLKLTAQGASEDIVWQLDSGNLPEGLTLIQKPCTKNPCLYEAVITGRPSADLTNETYKFEISAKTKTQSAKKAFNLKLLSRDEPFIEIDEFQKELVLSPGSEIRINWESQFVNNVFITLEKDGKTKLVIADNIDDRGSYTWKVPRDIIFGNNFNIKIRSDDPNISDITSSEISISDRPFSISSIRELRSEYKPNMKPLGLIVASDFQGVPISEDTGFTIDVRVFNFKNQDISNQILVTSQNLSYDSKKGGWPIEFKRTIDVGLYLIKATISCRNSSQNSCGAIYGTNSTSSLSKTFSVLGTQTPQITGTDKNIIQADDSLNIRGYQLATDDAAIIIRSTTNTLLNNGYELAQIIELNNINSDNIEINIPEKFKIVPARREIDLDLINSINNSPINSEPLSGDYTLTFISPKGISNSLPLKFENTNYLSLITGYERTLWTFPSSKRIEWITISPISQSKTPQRVSIYLDKNNCFIRFGCNNDDERIILTRNTPNDGVYDWNGTGEDGRQIPDGDYNIVIIDAGDPEIFTVSENKITISNSSINRR